MHTAQLERKAALDPRRGDTTLRAGDEVLRTKELLHAAEVGKLRPLGGPLSGGRTRGP